MQKSELLAPQKPPCANSRQRILQFPELREFCNPPLTTQELADTLTMAGLEVEELQPVAPPFTKASWWARSRKPCSTPTPTACACARWTWGRAPAQHRLRRAQCARGHPVPCALVGAELPPGDDGKPFLIKVGKLRGVESQGMLCSARELQAVGRPWRPAGAGCRRPAGPGHPRVPESGRHAVHPQAHAQSGALPERLRRGA
jgi:hypothetical protein